MSSQMSQEDKGQLTAMIIYLLDSWEIKASDQVQILDLPKGTPSRAIRKYRDSTPFPDSLAVMERVEHIVGIAEALSTTFPRNAYMAPQWMNQPHRRFGNRTPVKTIIEDGLSGLIAVRAHLDCTFAWDKSEH